MAIKVTVESSSESLGSVIIEKGRTYFYHDVIIGRLIVAASLGDDEGGEVYMADKVECETSDLTPGLVMALAGPRNLHRKLLPWFGIKLPIHLDGGEPGNLALQHQPEQICLFLVREGHSLD